LDIRSPNRTIISLFAGKMLLNLIELFLPLKRSNNASFMSNNGSFMSNNDSFMSNNDSFMSKNGSFMSKNGSFMSKNDSKKGKGMFRPLKHLGILLQHSMIARHCDIRRPVHTGNRQK